MFTGTITFTGNTEADVEGAVTEALKRIVAGNVMGFDSNESGSFTFSVSEDPPAHPDYDMPERG